MPSSKRSKKSGAIKRRRSINQSRTIAAVQLRGLDAAIAKLRVRAQAGETLSPSQLELLNRHGGVWPKSYD